MKQKWRRALVLRKNRRTGFCLNAEENETKPALLDAFRFIAFQQSSCGCAQGARSHIIWQEESMNSLQKNIAVTRGETIAAMLLASLALQSSLASIANRKEVLARMAEYVDSSLNLSGPAKGDPHDEFNTQVRETARFRAMEYLDEIVRNLPDTADRL